MSRVWCEVRPSVRVFVRYAIQCGANRGTNLCIANVTEEQVEGLPYAGTSIRVVTTYIQILN